MIGNVNALSWSSSIRTALGLPADIKDSIVFALGRPVEDAEYHNLFGDQDREADGGQVFPGRALAFDGVDQLASVSDNGALDINQASTDFSISGWTKATSTGTYQYLFGKHVAGGVAGKYGFFVDQVDNIVKFVVQSDTATYIIDTSVDVSVDTDWNFYSARIDILGLKVYVYVNGVLQNSGGTSFLGTFPSLTNGFKFYIANGNNGTGTGDTSYYLNGSVRDVRIYHKDLTSLVDRSDLERGEHLGDEVAWWFCEGTSTTNVYDSSGNAYHMTGINFDSTSFVEGMWQSLYNKFGYNINVTPIPPDMSTAIDGVPTHDVLGADLVFAGQAEYKAIARNRYCFVGDGDSYWTDGGGINPFSTEDWTLYFSAYIDDSITTSQSLFSQGSTSVAFRINPESSLWRVVIDDGTNVRAKNITFATLPLESRIYNFKFIEDGDGDLNIYENGNLVLTDSDPIGIAAAGAVTIGSRDGVEICGPEIKIISAKLYSDLTETNLKFQYEICEGRGTASYDVSGNSHHLSGINIDDDNWSVIDKPTEDYLAEHGANFIGSFNGVDDRYEIDSGSWGIANQDLTYASHFKALNNSGEIYIMGVGAIGGFNTIGVTMQADGTLRTRPFANATVASPLAYDDGKVHSLVETVDRSGNSTVYVDGVAVIVQDISSAGTSLLASNWNVGCENASSAYWDGAIFKPVVSLGIWTASDIAAYHDAGTIPVGIYSDELTGIESYDSQTWYGSGVHSLMIPALSDKSSDAIGNDILFKQSGSNLIPYTSLSMPENVRELFDADQAVRYEAGLMKEGRGTFNVELGGEEMLNNDFATGDFTDWIVSDNDGTVELVNDGGINKAHLVYGTANVYIRQDTITSGKKYKITFDATVTGLCAYYDGAVSYFTTGQNVIYSTAITAGCFFQTIAAGAEFDIWNITVKEVLNDSDVESWNPFSSNTLTNENNALVVESVDNALGAYCNLGASFDLNQNLVVGDTYVLIARAKTDSAQTDLTVEVGGYGVTANSPALNNEYQYLGLEFVAADVSGHNIRFTDMHVGDKVYLDRWELFHQVTATGNNLATNGGARSSIGSLITTDWDKTIGLQDIIAFEDYASVIDGSTKMRTLGDETVLNGDFTNWTTDDPDNFVLGFTEDASNYVTENPAGHAEILWDAGTFMYQTLPTTNLNDGDYVLVEINVSSYTSGIFRLYIGSSANEVQVTSVGIHRYITKRVGTSVMYLQGGTGGFDGTLDSISVKPITTAVANDLTEPLDSGRLIDQIPQGADEVVNGGFATDTDWNKGSAWTIAAGVATFDGTATVNMSQSAVVTGGKYYVLTFDTVDSGTYTLKITDGAGTYNYRVDDDSWIDYGTGTQTVILYIPSQADGSLSFYGTAGSNPVTIDNVVCKELQVLSDDLVTNGDFATDTDWNKNTGWTIAAGVASCDGTQTSDTAIFQAYSWGDGDKTLWVFTVSNYVAGSLNIKIQNGAGDYTAITANGTYMILADTLVSYPYIALVGDVDFIGDVDNLSIRRLTWGRQITDDSTNYSGFQFALPINEFDFAIPVDYIAETIVDQQFSDGLADGWGNELSSYPITTSIKTGDGFSGYTQRIMANNKPNAYAAIWPDSLGPMPEGTFIVSGKYRSNRTWNIVNQSGASIITPTSVAININDAIPFSVIMTISGSIYPRFQVAGELNNWLELDEIEIRHVIGGEFYEHEDDGGAPVIVTSNYLYENPSRYLTRYFNAVNWKDLILLRDVNYLTGDDHYKLMKYTKNS